MDSDKTTTRETTLLIVRDSLSSVQANPTNNQIALASLPVAFTAVEQYVASQTNVQQESKPDESGEESKPDESGEESNPDESDEESEEESGEESKPDSSGEESKPDESGEESEPDEFPDDILAKIAESESCAARLSERKAEIETNITDLEQQLTSVRDAYPDFYPLMSKKQFDDRKRAYKDADTAYITALRKLNNELMSVREDIEFMKAEIGKKLTIRGKPLPKDATEWNQYKVIRDLKVIRTRIKKQHQIPSSPSQEDTEFFKKYPYYSDLTRAAEFEFDNKVNTIIKKIKSLRSELKEVSQVLEEETWRPKYLTYAFKHNLKCDDENIFRVCNKHHMEDLLYDWRFDCPCDADQHDYDKYDDDSYGHTFCDGEGRCTHGTKMYVDWDVNDLDLGFIEEDYPAGVDVLFK